MGRTKSKTPSFTATVLSLENVKGGHRYGLCWGKVKLKKLIKGKLRNKHYVEHTAEHTGADAGRVRFDNEVCNKSGKLVVPTKLTKTASIQLPAPKKVRVYESRDKRGFHRSHKLVGTAYIKWHENLMAHNEVIDVQLCSPMMRGKKKKNSITRPMLRVMIDVNWAGHGMEDAERRPNEAKPGPTHSPVVGRDVPSGSNQVERVV